MNSQLLALTGTVGLGRHLEGSVSSCGETTEMPGWELALRLLGCVVLLSLSALFSGLTLGVLGLDTNQLKIVAASGSARERKAALIILPVRQNGNLLLCTLLLGNVAVNSLMSILMADLTSGLVGFISSTLLIVLLGEIVPQALCARHALRIGSLFIPIVRVFLVLTWPLSKPISMALDYALGEEIGTFYSRQEFHSLLKMHVQTNRLNAKEAAIMSGAIAFR
jgi:metal transporter CNNM